MTCKILFYMKCFFSLQYKAPDYLPVVYQDLPMPPTHRDVIVNAMVFVHQSMHKLNERESARGGQTVSVTPRSYLDFINHYVCFALLTIFRDFCNPPPPIKKIVQ